MSHEDINYVYRNFESNLRLHGSEPLAKIHIWRISQPFRPMLITQDKMEKPLIVRSSSARFILVPSATRLKIPSLFSKWRTTNQKSTRHCHFS